MSNGNGAFPSATQESCVQITYFEILETYIISCVVTNLTVLLTYPRKDDISYLKHYGPRDDSTFVARTLKEDNRAMSGVFDIAEGQIGREETRRKDSRPASS